jgi:hypothetical protein
MFLDKPERTKKEMTENKDGADQVGQESGPETTVNIGDDAEYDKTDTYIETVFNDNAIDLHNLVWECKDRRSLG